MKFPVRVLAKLLPFCRKDRSRYVLNTIQWNPANATCTATNGHVLACVTVKGRRPGTTPVLILARLLAQAMSCVRRFGRSLEFRKGRVRTCEWASTDLFDVEKDVAGDFTPETGLFPETNQVIPLRVPFAQAQFYDARYLRWICDLAIANSDNQKSAVLRLSFDPQKRTLRCDHHGLNADVLAVLMLVTMHEDIPLLQSEEEPKV